MDSDAIDTVKAFDMFWPPESLTCIVKVYEPAAVGVPEIVPELNRVGPAGSDPALTLHV
jgi:hypothetical protein